jgi:hypothetical protein
MSFCPVLNSNMPAINNSAGMVRGGSGGQIRPSGFNWLYEYRKDLN